jgi:hypothetical protein
MPAKPAILNEVHCDATLTVTPTEFPSNTTGSNVNELGNVPILIALVVEVVDQLSA